MFSKRRTKEPAEKRRCSANDYDIELKRLYLAMKDAGQAVTNIAEEVFRAQKVVEIFGEQSKYAGLAKEKVKMHRKMLETACEELEKAKRDWEEYRETHQNELNQKDEYWNLSNYAGACDTPYIHVRAAVHDMMKR